MVAATVSIITVILVLYLVENAKWVSSLFKMMTGAQLKIDNDLVAFSGARFMKAHV